MHRLSTTQPFTCATCEVEIVGPAVIHVGLPFCCAGCVAEGPCSCSYDLAVAADCAAAALVQEPVGETIRIAAPAEHRVLVAASID